MPATSSSSPGASSAGASSSSAGPSSTADAPSTARAPIDEYESEHESEFSDEWSEEDSDLDSDDCGFDSDDKLSLDLVEQHRDAYGDMTDKQIRRRIRDMDGRIMRSLETTAYDEVMRHGWSRQRSSSPPPVSTEATTSAAAYATPSAPPSSSGRRGQPPSSGGPRTPRLPRAPKTPCAPKTPRAPRIEKIGRRPRRLTLDQWKQRLSPDRSSLEFRRSERRSGWLVPTYTEDDDQEAAGVYFPKLTKKDPEDGDWKDDFLTPEQKERGKKAQVEVDVWGQKYENRELQRGLARINKRVILDKRRKEAKKAKEERKKKKEQEAKEKEEEAKRLKEQKEMVRKAKEEARRRREEARRRREEARREREQNVELEEHRNREEVVTRRDRERIAREERANRGGEHWQVYDPKLWK